MRAVLISVPPGIELLDYLINSLATGDRLARIHVVGHVIALALDIVGRDPATTARIEVCPQPPVVKVALTVNDLASPASAPHILGISAGIALSNLSTGIIRSSSTDGCRPDVDI